MAFLPTSVLWVCIKPIQTDQAESSAQMNVIPILSISQVHKREGRTRELNALRQRDIATHTITFVEINSLHTRAIASCLNWAIGYYSLATVASVVSAFRRFFSRPQQETARCRNIYNLTYIQTLSILQPFCCLFSLRLPATEKIIQILDIAGSVNQWKKSSAHFIFKKPWVVC